MTGPKIVKGKDGSTFILGDENVQVGPFRIKIDNEIVAESDAIDNFRFALTRLTVLLDHADAITEEMQKNAGLVKLTIWQLGIVMLASALEAYGRKRLLELEALGRIKDWKEVFRNAGATREEISGRAESNGRTLIEQLIEERRVNFNDLDEFTRLYEGACGLRVTDLEREDIYRIIRFRNDIVHGGFRSEILNWDRVPKQTPIPVSSQKVRELMNRLETFVQSVQSRS